MTLPAVVAALAFVPMLAEARRASRHDRALLASGALEPPGDVYRAMRIIYPACFAAMIAEGWLRGAGFGGRFAAGLAVFAGAKAIKYWAIAALGPRWSFRVLVPRGAPPIESGPYRYLRHPNYAGVVGELAGTALMTAAPIAGLASLAVFGGLLAARIRVEERALSSAGQPGTDQR
jgi:methyltransferase